MVDEELPASRASVLLKLKLCAIESILNVCLKNKAPQFQGGFVIILAILAGYPIFWNMTKLTKPSLCEMTCFVATDRNLISEAEMT